MDELNNGYLSHGILYKFYRIIDYIGYKLIKRNPLKLSKVPNQRLLFINLGLIGDLVLFRYVINEFLKLDYTIDILIQKQYSFLFSDLPNLNILKIANYKDKKILSGFLKIFRALKTQPHYHYAVACHFRGYLGTGILATFLARVAINQIGYATSGFGFLLNKCVKWQPYAHETTHLLDILRLIEPQYNYINLRVFDYCLVNNEILNKYNLVNQKYIVIHPTSQNDKKNIPQHMLKYTIDYLLNNTDWIIVIVGTETERSYVEMSLQITQLVTTKSLIDKNNKAEKLNSRLIFTNGQISLFDVRCMVSSAKFFIGVDSSIAHLVSSLKLPKIILWHSLNLLIQWRPLGDNFIIIEPNSLTHNSIELVSNNDSNNASNNLIINKLIQIGIIKYENTLN
ncbi:MAG: glycosyltransferase family 9 protein [Burkholderiales bacterium]|nr:glycosyltransferase family 9 protein [Burkholderiales bacterium]